MSRSAERRVSRTFDSLRLSTYLSSVLGNTVLPFMSISYHVQSSCHHTRIVLWRTWPTPEVSSSCMGTKWSVSTQIPAGRLRYRSEWFVSLWSVNEGVIDLTETCSSGLTIGTPPMKSRRTDNWPSTLVVLPFGELHVTWGVFLLAVMAHGIVMRATAQPEVDWISSRIRCCRSAVSVDQVGPWSSATEMVWWRFPCR